MSIVYFEGAFMPQEEARVPVTDRGFLFGDGAYATIRVENGEPQHLEVHLERLEEQCRSFGLEMPPVGSIQELIRLNQAEEGVWRLKVIVTGGDDPAPYLPNRQGRLLLTLERYEPPASTPLRLGVFPYPFHLCHASFKSLAHLNRYYVMEEARRQGLDDCVTVTEGGIVLEAAFGNLCWIVDRTIYTPSRDLPLYFGVTLTQFIEEKIGEGYVAQEVEIPLEELPEEARYFRTNTMGGVRPIAEIGGRSFTVQQPADIGVSLSYKII
jgi:4-amino-4-deoxychorismate lyase